MGLNSPTADILESG